VLDLACGSGRHVRWLADRGYQVLACDRDSAALEQLREISQVETRCFDLENGGRWPFKNGEFDAVVVTNYLHRPLFPLIASALAPNAVLIYETFALGNERHGKPSNPLFLLHPGELLRAFGSDLFIAAFEQGRLDRPKAALIQRLCALRCDGREVALQSPAEVNVQTAGEVPGKPPAGA